MWLPNKQGKQSGTLVKYIKYFFFGKIYYIFHKVKNNKCGHQEDLNWCGFMINFQNHKCDHQEKLWGFILNIKHCDDLVIFI